MESCSSFQTVSAFREAAFIRGASTNHSGQPFPQRLSLPSFTVGIDFRCLAILVFILSSPIVLKCPFDNRVSRQARAKHVLWRDHACTVATPRISENE